MQTTTWIDAQTKIITKERGTIRIGECTEQEHVLNDRGAFTAIQLHTGETNQDSLEVQLESGQSVTLDPDTYVRIERESVEQEVRAKHIHKTTDALKLTEARYAYGIKKQTDITIPPYALGHMTAAGRTSRLSPDYVKVNDRKKHVFNRCMQELEQFVGTGLKRVKQGTAKDYSYDRLKRSAKDTEKLNDALCELNLINTPKERMTIPDAYRYANEKNRYQFIRGVVDSIGQARTDTAYGNGFIVAQPSEWFRTQFLEMCHRTNISAYACEQDPLFYGRAVFVVADACFEFDRTTRKHTQFIRNRDEKRKVKTVTRKLTKETVGVTCQNGHIALANGLTI